MVIVFANKQTVVMSNKLGHAAPQILDITLQYSNAHATVATTGTSIISIVYFFM